MIIFSNHLTQDILILYLLFFHFYSFPSYSFLLIRSKIITISQWLVIGNMSTGCAETGLNGNPGYFLVLGAHSIVASLVRVFVGLQLT
mmetsp:Transcript_22080/g.50453  ORF Transcript_22080/g.50453 Transcript_22080/m.50453 type:complete len:88 (+) Transcript_22080:74-337(+)